MLPVENNFNKNGLPHVYITLFRCLWVPGGGLEPFRRALRSGGWLPLKKNTCTVFFFGPPVMLPNLIQQKWRTAAEGENCMKYVNSYLMNCTMNIFEALSREINLNCYGV